MVVGEDEETLHLPSPRGYVVDGDDDAEGVVGWVG